jgi:ABC-2 type transport system permease protein
MHKEFTLILRDRGTIALLIMMPLMTLLLFGFAIQLDPKHLPTAIIDHDQTPLTRALVSNMDASGYFWLVEPDSNERQAVDGLLKGRLTIVLTIPGDFTRNFVRGDTPPLLIEVDGSDPGNSINAVNQMPPIIDQTVEEFTRHGLPTASPPVKDRKISLIVHRNFNESNRSAWNIVPGLIGVLLTMTMVMITATAITSERESGTMELLLTTPLKPTEIILGKVIPYVALGYLQLTSVVILGSLLIELPIEGSLPLLYLASAPFIVANLMVGMIFSTVARTPMQAMQLSFFFMLPSIFLSGYVFSYYGMPEWARAIGSALPMTYYMRISRGIFLKGSGMADILPNVLYVTLIATLLVVVTTLKFRRTLD